MKKGFVFLLGATAVMAGWAGAGQAEAGLYFEDKNCCAISSPVDCPACIRQPKSLFTPFYSPLTPIASRWRYHSVVPYYRGYCKASAGCGESGNMEMAVQPGAAAGTYGTYTGSPTDEEAVLRLGGAGASNTPVVVPSGAPVPSAYVR